MSALAIPPRALPGISDGDLVLRALEGDDWATTALYRRHARPLASLVARLLSSTADVEDIVHDVFVDSIRKLSTLREPSAYRAWVRQIAVMRARGVLRRRAITRRLGLYQPCEDATLDAIADPKLGPEERAEFRNIDRALRTLSAEERLVWMLRHIEGESTVEIVDLIGRSSATVKRRLKSAEKKVVQHCERGAS